MHSGCDQIAGNAARVEEAFIRPSTTSYASSGRQLCHVTVRVDGSLGTMSMYCNKHAAHLRRSRVLQQPLVVRALRCELLCMLLAQRGGLRGGGAALARGRLGLGRLGGQLSSERLDRGGGLLDLTSNSRRLNSGSCAKNWWSFLKPQFLFTAMSYRLVIMRSPDILIERR